MYMYFHSSPISLQLLPIFPLVFFFLMEAVCKLQFLLLIHMCIYSIFVKAVFLFSPKNFSFLPPKLCPVCSPQYWKSGLSSRVSVDYSVHHLPKWWVQRHLQIRNTTWSHSQQINASISERCGHVKTRHNIQATKQSKKVLILMYQIY